MKCSILRYVDYVYVSWVGKCLKDDCPNWAENKSLPFRLNDRVWWWNKARLDFWAFKHLGLSFFCLWLNSDCRNSDSWLCVVERRLRLSWFFSFLFTRTIISLLGDFLWSVTDLSPWGIGRRASNWNLFLSAQLNIRFTLFARKTSNLIH